MDYKERCNSCAYLEELPNGAWGCGDFMRECKDVSKCDVGSIE